MGAQLVETYRYSITHLYTHVQVSVIRFSCFVAFHDRVAVHVPVYVHPTTQLVLVYGGMAKPVSLVSKQAGMNALEVLLIVLNRVRVVVAK
jgi:hypothetical protein